MKKKMASALAGKAGWKCILFPNFLLWFTRCIVTGQEVSEDLVSCLIHPQYNEKIQPHFCRISAHTVCHISSIPLTIMEQDCPRSCFQVFECIVHLEEQEYMSFLTQAEVWAQVCTDSHEWLVETWPVSPFFMGKKIGFYISISCHI